MTKYKFFKILSILFTLVFSISAHAAGTCLVDKSDIKSDMKKIAEKLDVVYASDAKSSSVNKIYDNQQLIVDRTDPFLKQVNAVGVIKAQPNGINHATAILISPCHVLVNAHAVTNQQAKKSLDFVYISLGQNRCNLPNEFVYSDIPGRVIAIGDGSENERDINSAHDYSIIKISQTISDIDLPIIAEENMLVTDTLMMVGYPEDATSDQKSGLRYPTASFTKPTLFNKNGMFKISNNATREGSSGSGLFVLDKSADQNRQTVLTGIHVGSNRYGAIAIQTSSILAHLKSTNPQVYNQLKSSIESNTCK